MSTKDDYQCIDLSHQYCWDEDKIVKDRTCIYSVDFECGKHKNLDGKGSVNCDKVPTKKCYDTPRKVIIYCEVHFLPVFGCLGYSAWNITSTFYSVVLGSSFFSLKNTFQPREWSRVCWVAPETTPLAEKSRF